MVKKYPITSYSIYALVNLIGLLFSTYAFSTAEVTVSKTSKPSLIEVTADLSVDFDPYDCSLKAKVYSPSGKIPTIDAQLFFYPEKNAFSGELNASDFNSNDFTDTEIKLSAFSEESSCKPNLDTAQSINGINLILDGVKISGVKLLPNIPTLNIFLDLNSHSPVQNILLNKPSASEINWPEPATKSFVLETVLPQISRQLEFIEEKDITLFFHSEKGISSEIFKREDLQNDMAFARSILRITDQNSLAFEDKDYTIFNDTNWSLFSSISEPVIISDLRPELFCEIFATMPDASIIRLGTSPTTSCTSNNKAYPTIDLEKLITKSSTEQKYLISSSLFQKETDSTVSKLNPLKADIQSSDNELDETKIALAASLARQQRLELELFETSDGLLKSQRETALLNQQVLELRRQLSSLQSILALSEEKDREDEIQLQNLGNRLNAALARIASEERKKRQLEQSLRIEIEAKLNEITILNSQLIALKLDLERAETEAKAVGLESTLKIERQKNKNLIAEKQELQKDVERLKVLLARSLAKQISLDKEVAGNAETQEVDIEDYEKKQLQIDILNVRIKALERDLVTSNELLAAAVLNNQKGKKPDNNTNLKNASISDEDIKYLLDRVAKCWRIDVGSLASRVTVTVSFSLDANGKIESNEIKLISTEGGEGSAARTAFVSAKRALFRCQKDGYKLPSTDPAKWKDIKITFDPTRIED